ncbi:MAG: phospholipase D family protein [Hyphomonadaceae bacterium]
MPSAILTSGLGQRTFDDVLRKGIRKGKPSVLGVAVAYVSVAGWARLSELVSAAEISELCLVTDTRDCVTHPSALSAALAAGFDVRVVDGLAGTFHPKVYLGGASFDADRSVVSPTLAIVGSANLSRAALSRNGECSYLRVGSNIPDSARVAWRQCWAVGAPLTAPNLELYAKAFAKRNKARAIADMIALGVSDNDVASAANSAAPTPSMPKAVATAAWAGLQSFTGAYTLQVEFPRDPGLILQAMLGSAGTQQFLCADNVMRDFVFKYYDDNSMFRLNIPNDTPLADWARATHDGIALVETAAGSPTRFEIVQPGKALDDIEARSLALGTLGQTPTRRYGWY